MTLRSGNLSVWSDPAAISDYRKLRAAIPEFAALDADAADAAIAAPGPILELGCGDGSWAADTLARGYRGSMVLVDASAVMAAACKKRLAGASGVSVEHRRVDAANVPDLLRHVQPGVVYCGLSLFWMAGDAWPRFLEGMASGAAASTVLLVFDEFLARNPAEAEAWQRKKSGSFRRKGLDSTAKAYRNNSGPAERVSISEFESRAAEADWWIDETRQAGPLALIRARLGKE